jgi:hypothetical protein
MSSMDDIATSATEVDWVTSGFGDRPAAYEVYPRRRTTEGSLGPRAQVQPALKRADAKCSASRASQLTAAMPVSLLLQA